jgi:hypothetical protein
MADRCTPSCSRSNRGNREVSEEPCVIDFAAIVDERVHVSVEMHLAGVPEPSSRVCDRDPSQLPERRATMAQIIGAEGRDTYGAACPSKLVR